VGGEHASHSASLQVEACSADASVSLLFRGAVVATPLQVPARLRASPHPLPCLRPQVMNAVRDCRLFPELQTPDSGCLQTHHIDTNAVPPHYDAENMFGEVGSADDLPSLSWGSVAWCCLGMHRLAGTRAAQWALPLVSLLCSHWMQNCCRPSWASVSGPAAS
jgi:hypothetical protein